MSSYAVDERVARVRGSLGSVAVALTLFLGAACIGDRSTEVVVTNETAQQVAVYPYGRDYPGVRWLLEAGAAHRANLLAGDARPETHVAFIEAVDDTNTLIFCHSYSYGELKELKGEVRIKEGKIDCK